MNKDDIKKRLVQYFQNSYIEVIDLTSDSNHFSIIIISDIFIDLSLINRHKKVYSLFQNELTKEIHALQIKAFTKAEWKSKK